MILDGLYRLARPLLFRLDAEVAHERAVAALKLAQRTPGGLALLARALAAPARPTTLAGIALRNPIGLAAGFDKNAELVPALAALGFGYVEVGTVTRHAQPGNERPRLFRHPAERALVNRLGFNNVGVEVAARHLEALATRPIPIGINLGKSKVTPLEEATAEYAWSLRRLYALGDYFTVNISSPNTADLRRLHEPARLLPLLDALADVAAQLGGRRPLFLKLSPDAADADLLTAARLAAERGFGLVLTNTTVARTPAQADWEPGGLSGAPLRARATAVVALVRAAVGSSVPIIGVGGIMSRADVDERRAAGADAVQIYTGFIYNGPRTVALLLGA